MSEEMKVFCTQCGSENSAEAKFCANCGSKLEPHASAQETTQPQTTDNVYAEGLPQEEAAPAYEKVTEAEEIKPEPIPEEIQINYDNVQGNFSADGSNEYTSTYSNPSAQYNSSVPTAEVVNGGNIGVAIASLVCGILSLVCCCLSWFSFVLAVAAIVLGIITLVKKYDGKGMAIAGIVTAGIGIFIFIICIGISAAMPYEEILDEIVNEMY